MEFYLEIEAEKKKPESYIGILTMLRSEDLNGGFRECISFVNKLKRQFKSKLRNPKRPTRINYLRVVDMNHETVFEVKM